MKHRDWFRSSTWTESDRSEFFARLNRARPRSRSQYLRIQALHLRDAGLASNALELLDVMLKDYPDRTELACAHVQKARCLEDLGRLDEAEREYRHALEIERQYPNVTTTVWVDFGWFVVTHDRRNSFVDAIHVLDAHEPPGIRFPVWNYQSHAIRAIVAGAFGRPAEAREHASIALRAAAATHSGLRFHPTLGLVHDPRGRVHDRLKELAGSSPDA